MDLSGKCSNQIFVSEWDTVVIRVISIRRVINRTETRKLKFSNVKHNSNTTFQKQKYNIIEISYLTVGIRIIKRDWL